MAVIAIRTLTARDAMSAPAVTVPPGTSPWAAWSLMRARGLRHLVVSVDGRCVGMLDDRALFALWPLGPLAMRRSCVETMMRRWASCVLPDTDLRQAAELMVGDGIDAVPVVDELGQILGIVTGGDIAAAVAVHGITEVVKDGVECDR